MWRGPLFVQREKIKVQAMLASSTVFGWCTQSAALSLHHMIGLDKSDLTIAY